MSHRPEEPPVGGTVNSMDSVESELAFQIGVVKGDVHVHQSTPVEPSPTAMVEVLRQGRDTDLLVGRGNEVQQLMDLLTPARPAPEPDGQRAVVVAGMGGIGKTALATHTALMTLDDDCFPGGVLLVDLRGYVPGQAPVLPQQVYAALLRALGVPAEQIPSTPSEQAGLYHAVLDQLAAAGKPVLLVLDNAADTAQVRDLLPRNAAHRALVTTRDILVLPHARRIFLDVLDQPAAAELLTQLRDGHPRGPRPDAEEESLLRLVDVCGRLPLAVQIAAAILTDEPTLTITELVGQLTDPSVRLHAMTYGGGDIATVIDVSYQRLAARAPEATDLLALLTLNPGPDLSTDTAAAIAGTSTAIAATRLRALRAASLLQHTPAGRWRLHDLLALYARQRLTPDIEAPATTRLLDHYTHTARTAHDHLEALPGKPVPDRFTGRQAALDWFDAEHANLVAAVGLAHRTGQLQHTIQLAGRMAPYLSWRWHLTDLVAVASQASTAAATLGDPHTQAVAWNTLGNALQGVRRFDDAVTAHQTARDLFRKLGDRHGEGMAWDNLGNALQEVRRFDDAVTAHQTARDLFQKLGDHHLEGMAWNNLGNALQEVRRFDDAVTAHQTARDLFQRLGERHGEGAAWINLGLALQEVRRFDDAVTAHQTARDLFQKLGDHHSEGKAWNNLGNALQKVRRFDDAVTAHQTARDLFQKLGDRHSEGIAWGTLGMALLEARRFHEAVRAWSGTVAAFEDTGEMELAAQMRHLLEKLDLSKATDPPAEPTGA